MNLRLLALGSAYALSLVMQKLKVMFAIVVSLYAGIGRADSSTWAALDAQRETHRSIKRLGIVLTILGTAATVVGSSVYAHGFDKSGTSMMYVGPSLMVLGQSAVVSGIFVWVISATKEDRLKRQLEVSAGGVVGRF